MFWAEFYMPAQLKGIKLAFSKQNDIQKYPVITIIILKPNIDLFIFFGS